MDNVLITGVSTGIGFATAKYLCNRGFRVFGSVRKSTDTQWLQQEFGDNFVPLIFDVTDQQAIDQAVLEVSEILQEERLLALVNNAGIAVSGPLEHLDMGDLELQFDVNVYSVIRITQAFLPFLKNTTHGSRIINIGSISGIMTRPFTGPYSASKHALEALTDALRRELMVTSNVKVILIQAGPIKTSIWKKARNDKRDFKGTAYEAILKYKNNVIDQAEEMAIEVKEITLLIHKIITDKNPKTRYLLTKKKWLIQLVAYVLPDKWVDHLFMKQLKKFRRD